MLVSEKALGLIKRARTGKSKLELGGSGISVSQDSINA